MLGLDRDLLALDPLDFSRFETDDGHLRWESCELSTEQFSLSKEKEAIYFWHTVYENWIIHCWHPGLDYCIMHVESDPDSRFQLAQKFSLYAESFHQACEITPPECVDRRVPEPEVYRCISLKFDIYTDIERAVNVDEQLKNWVHVFQRHAQTENEAFLRDLNMRRI